MKVNTHPTLLSDILVSNLGGIVNEILNDKPIHKAFQPRLDLTEHEEKYHLAIHLPGIDKNEINIHQEDSILSVTGERKAVANNGKPLVTETQYGFFERKVRLPKNTNLEEIEAEYQNGVLHISIGKKTEALPRSITIK